jgi:hypothetical protein
MLSESNGLCQATVWTYALFVFCVIMALCALASLVVIIRASSRLGLQKLLDAKSSTVVAGFVSLAALFKFTSEVTQAYGVIQFDGNRYTATTFARYVVEAAFGMCLLTVICIFGFNLLVTMKRALNLELPSVNRNKRAAVVDHRDSFLTALLGAGLAGGAIPLYMFDFASLSNAYVCTVLAGSWTMLRFLSMRLRAQSSGSFRPSAGTALVLATITDTVDSIMFALIVLFAATIVFVTLNFVGRYQRSTTLLSSASLPEWVIMDSSLVWLVFRMSMFLSRIMEIKAGKFAKNEMPNVIITPPVDQAVAIVNADERAINCHDRTVNAHVNAFVAPHEEPQRHQPDVECPLTQPQTQVDAWTTVPASEAPSIRAATTVASVAVIMISTISVDAEGFDTAVEESPVFDSAVHSALGAHLYETAFS